MKKHKSQNKASSTPNMILRNGKYVPSNGASKEDRQRMTTVKPFLLDQQFANQNAPKINSQNYWEKIAYARNAYANKYYKQNNHMKKHKGPRPLSQGQKIEKALRDYAKLNYSKDKVNAIRYERDVMADKLMDMNRSRKLRNTSTSTPKLVTDYPKHKSKPGDLYNAYQKKKAASMKKKSDCSPGEMYKIHQMKHKDVKSTPTKKTISPATIARVKNRVAQLGGMSKAKSRIKQAAAAGAIPGFDQDENLSHDDIAQRVIDAIKELVSLGQNAYAATKDDLSEFVSDLSWFFHVTTPPKQQQEEDPETPDYSNPAYNPPKTPPPTGTPVDPKERLNRIKNAKIKEFKKTPMKRKSAKSKKKFFSFLKGNRTASTSPVLQFKGRMKDMKNQIDAL